MKIYSLKNVEEVKVINPKTPKFPITPKIHKEIIQGDLPLTKSTVTALKLHALLNITFIF